MQVTWTAEEQVERSTKGCRQVYARSRAFLHDYLYVNASHSNARFNQEQSVISLQIPSMNPNLIAVECAEREGGSGLIIIRTHNTSLY